MARIRLTNKTRIAANDSYDPYNPTGDRQDYAPTRYKKYENFNPEKDDVGGRGKAQTDGSKLHQIDTKLRDDMNITKIRVVQAKMWQRSKLATKLAMYLLGEKAPQSMIKAQAAEFLSLGNEKLAKAVSRWAKTEYLYAADDEPEGEPEAPAKDESEAPAEDEPEGEPEGEPEAPAKDESEAPADDEPEGEPEAPAKDEPKDEPEATVADGKTDGDEQAVVGDVTAACTCGECDQCKNQAEAGLVAEEPEGEGKGTEDASISEQVLASLFEDNCNTLVANKKEAKSGKVGVQQFEQPQRVASNKVSLDQLWEGAPDLSNIF